MIVRLGIGLLHFRRRAGVCSRITAVSEQHLAPGHCDCLRPLAEAPVGPASSVMVIIASGTPFVSQRVPIYGTFNQMAFHSAARPLPAPAGARRKQDPARRQPAIPAGERLALRHHVAVPTWFHLVAGAWIVAMLVLGNGWPAQYEAILQEDRIVEWATVGLFLMAGVVGLVRSVRQRRLFDGLVALFCLFVAGEEFSWGQRLIGYYPSEFFLANNFQQEANLHNFSQWFAGPKWFLMAAMAGYALLPLLSRIGGVDSLLKRLGATSPPVGLLPWFAAAIALLWWYPLTLTGEWVELLAGGTFLAASGPPRKTLWALVAAAAVFGMAMTAVTGALEGGRDAARIPCATTEAQTLLDDVMVRAAATSKLWQYRRVHKRVWTSIEEGYLRADRTGQFTGVACDGAAAEHAELRHRYAIDPWGSSYWILAERLQPTGRRISVYSFGPNRRRDGGDDANAGAGIGDDIVVGIVR